MSPADLQSATYQPGIGSQPHQRRIGSDPQHAAGGNRSAYGNHFRRVRSQQLRKFLRSGGFLRVTAASSGGSFTDGRPAYQLGIGRPTSTTQSNSTQRESQSQNDQPEPRCS